MKRHRAREIPVGGAVACLARSLRREGTNLRSTFCCVPLTAYAFIAAVSATSVAAFLRCQQQPSQLAPIPRPPPRPAQQTTHLSMHLGRQHLSEARSHHRRLSRCQIKSINRTVSSIIHVGSRCHTTSIGLHVVLSVTLQDTRCHTTSIG